eukprot:CAMPEP_0114143464 /NCGR_PEP_ID=MMETSP0043_2-20121206/19000_1 /TAXON_ID=464988 /ORGANISM="Hemiselmis andersenii, Strain CCMP644" /LENGTH=80 /DNA_ID=CAMNT_0001237763 /DNA_START=85 /DNA_END=327 /DNA_ORIENTATION=-
MTSTLPLRRVSPFIKSVCTSSTDTWFASKVRWEAWRACGLMSSAWARELLGKVCRDDPRSAPELDDKGGVQVLEGSEVFP